MPRKTNGQLAGPSASVARPIGAGGWNVGGQVTPDGRRIARTDTFHAFLQTPSGFVPLFRPGVNANLADTDRTPPDYEYALGAYEVRANPANSQKIWLGTIGRVFTRDSDGQQWRRTALPYNAKMVESANNRSRLGGPFMAPDPSNLAVLHLGICGQGVRYTTDDGLTWPTPTGLPTISGNERVVVMVDDTSPPVGGRRSVVYAHIGGFGLYRSADGGASYAAVGGPQIIFHGKMRAGKVYLAGAITLDAQGNELEGLQRYVHGNGFTVLKTTGTRAIAFNPADPNLIYRADDGSRLSVSTDDGATFSQPRTPKRIANDIPWLAWTNENFMSCGELEFDPTTGMLVLFEGIGAWDAPAPPASQTGDFTWTSISKGQDQIVIGSLRTIHAPGDPADGTLLVAGHDRPLFVFARDDLTYPSRHGPDRLTNLKHSGMIDYAQGDFDYLAASSGISSGPGRTVPRVFTSTARGQGDWPGTPTLPLSVSTIADLNEQPWGGEIAVTAVGKFCYLNSNNSPLEYTLDGGQTWALVDLPAGVKGMGHYTRASHRIVADKLNPGVLYFFTHGIEETPDSPGIAGFYEILNHGAGPVTRVSPRLGGYAINAYNCKLKQNRRRDGHWAYSAGHIGGEGKLSNPMYFSSDRCRTFLPIPGIFGVYAFDFGKGLDGYEAIYAWGFDPNGREGMYRALDFNPATRACTWEWLHGFEKANFDTVADLAGDMTRFGRYYLGFTGSGVVAYDYAAPEFSRAA